jgi:hypothetical protein
LIGSSQLQFATPFSGNFLVTLMLASVTDAEEAETAVQHGAEIIDVKDVDGPVWHRRAQAQPEALARTLRRLSSTLARAALNSVCMHTRRRRIACAR